MALTPSTAVEPSRHGYRIELNEPRDRDAVRDRFSRWVSSLTASIAVIAIPMLFIGYCGKLFGPNARNFGLLIGFFFGVILLSKVINRLLIYNKEWSAYVTNDMFSGDNVPYGPGLHPSHFWERRNETGNYPLTVITQEFKLNVPTKTAKVTVYGVLQYAIDLSRITKFIGVDETTVESGFIGLVEGYLLTELAKETAEECRASIPQINEGLAITFMRESGIGARLDQFEEQYGVVTVSIFVRDMGFSTRVQNARDAIDQAVSLHGVVAGFLGITSQTLNSQIRRGILSQSEYQALLITAMSMSGEANMSVIEGTAVALAAQTFSRLAGTTPSPRTS